MERIKTLDTRDLCESAKNGGCGECQTSCQSACKTSCGVANQKCENKSEKQFAREVGFITKLISERIRHLLLGGVSFSVYVSAAILITCFNTRILDSALAQARCPSGHRLDFFENKLRLAKLSLCAKHL